MFPIADADRTAPSPVVFPLIADGDGGRLDVNRKVRLLEEMSVPCNMDVAGRHKAFLWRNLSEIVHRKTGIIEQILPVRFSSLRR